MLNLRNYLLDRVNGVPCTGVNTEYPRNKRLELSIIRNTIYSHKVVRFNYTDYCLRRQQDSINPSSHADIMIPDFTSKNITDFTYARVIGIYHVLVQMTGELDTRSFDFLHVRWYTRPVTRKWRLPQLSFFDTTNPANLAHAFGFLDPAQVIRGVHILPAFHHGPAQLLLAPSFAIGKHLDLREFKLHYVGMYVSPHSLCLHDDSNTFSFSDRDLFFRHTGLSIPQAAAAVIPTSDTDTSSSQDSSEVQSENAADVPGVEMEEEDRGEMTANDRSSEGGTT
jgi:hypothetical protein